MQDEKTVITITNVADFERQTEQFSHDLIAHFQGSSRENILLYLLAELGDNIKQHSQARHAVLDLSAGPNQMDDLIISDDGIGIGASFRNTGLNIDDQEALTLALKGRSTKKEGNRGWGLRTVVAIIRELKGSFEISSGNTRAIVETNQPSVIKIPERKGTTVALTLPHTIDLPDKIFYNILEGQQ